MTRTRALLVVALIAGSSLALHVARAQPPGIRRTDLQRHELDVAGREVVQVRFDFEPGVGFGRHSHPGARSSTSSKGRSNTTSRGSRRWRSRRARSCSSEPAQSHAAKNVGSGNGAELATYIVEKGKPLVVLAK